MQGGERMTFYQCNPELFRRCKKTYCGKECTLTTFEKYAQRDEFGRPIGVRIDDLFELAEEPARGTHERKGNA